MVRIILWAWLLTASSLGLTALSAQQPEYAPPPDDVARALPPPESIIIPFWQRIDWRDPRNQTMFGLGVGSLVLVKVAFRKMTE